MAPQESSSIPRGGGSPTKNKYGMRKGRGRGDQMIKAVVFGNVEMPSGGGNTTVALTCWPNELYEYKLDPPPTPAPTPLYIILYHRPGQAPSDLKVSPKLITYIYIYIYIK